MERWEQLCTGTLRKSPVGSTARPHYGGGTGGSTFDVAAISAGNVGQTGFDRPGTAQWWFGGRTCAEREGGGTDCRAGRSAHRTFVGTWAGCVSGFSYDYLFRRGTGSFGRVTVGFGRIWGWRIAIRYAHADYSADPGSTTQCFSCAGTWQCVLPLLFKSGGLALGYLEIVSERTGGERG